MARQTSAWESEDGKLFLSKDDAVQQDLRVRLGQLNTFKGDTIEQIIEKRFEILKLLKQIETPDTRNGNEETSNA